VRPLYDFFPLLQDFINDTRALCNSSRLKAINAGGFAPRRGFCTTAAEAMSLCVINSWVQRLRLCREIAAALAKCHAAGVLHRDLTSFNVMLSETQEAATAAQADALCWRDQVSPHMISDRTPPFNQLPSG
jgi:hypothetical protein